MRLHQIHEATRRREQDERAKFIGKVFEFSPPLLNVIANGQVLIELAERPSRRWTVNVLHLEVDLLQCGMIDDVIDQLVRETERRLVFKENALSS